MKYTPQILTIALQKQILKLVDAGQSYEQIRAELHVTSTSIARVITRRQAFRDKLVDTAYHGQPMHAKGGMYVPTPDEIEQRVAIIWKRHAREKREEEHVKIQEVSLADLGIWVHGGARS